MPGFVFIQFGKTPLRHELVSLHSESGAGWPSHGFNGFVETALSDFQSFLAQPYADKKHWYREHTAAFPSICLSHKSCFF